MPMKSAVVCHLQGRFGNQLFQYWISRMISDKLERPLHVMSCRDLFMITSFPNVKYDLFRKGITPPSFVSERPNTFDWVSWAIDTYRDIPNEQICITTFSESYELVAKYEDQIREYYSSPRFLDEPENMISIHVRLGDLAHVNASVNDYINYCADTIRDIKDKDPTVDAIYIVSDEPHHAYIKQLTCALGVSGVSLSSGKSVEDDFMSLRNSKYIIMQNSTFAWWAGFLADKDKTRVYAYACDRLGCGFRNADLFAVSPSNFTVTRVY